MKQFIVLAAALFLLGCISQTGPVSTPSISISIAPTATPTATMTATPVPSDTKTATPAPTASQTSTPTPSPQSVSQQAQDACIQLCLDAKAQNQDLANGPCLSSNVAPDWVCDVAHDPRQPVDDFPENQCPEFGVSANHFVEVDENCQVIFVE